MKVGNLVRWKGLNSRTFLGIIVGFDDENDPIVKTCCTGNKMSHWRDKLEVVSESDPPRGTADQLGLVIDMETVEQAVYNPKVAKVQWLGGEYPPFMYKPDALIVVSEA